MVSLYESDSRFSFELIRFNTLKMAAFFAGNIFKLIFLTENSKFWSTQFLYCIEVCPWRFGDIDKRSALVLVMAYQRMGDNVNWTHTTKYYRNAPLPNRITISKPMVLEPAWVQFCIGTLQCVYMGFIENIGPIYLTELTYTSLLFLILKSNFDEFISKCNYLFTMVEALQRVRYNTVNHIEHMQQLHKYSMDKTWDYTVLCSGNLRWDFELRQKTPSRPNLRCKGVARSVIRKSFGQTLQITVNLYLEMQSSHVITRSNITR